MALANPDNVSLQVDGAAGSTGGAAGRAAAAGGGARALAALACVAAAALAAWCAALTAQVASLSSDLDKVRKRGCVRACERAQRRRGREGRREEGCVRACVRAGAAEPRCLPVGRTTLLSRAAAGAARCTYSRSYPTGARKGGGGGGGGRPAAVGAVAHRGVGRVGRQSWLVDGSAMHSSACQHTLERLPTPCACALSARSFAA